MLLIIDPFNIILISPRKGSYFFVNSAKTWLYIIYKGGLIMNKEEIDGRAFIAFLGALVASVGLVSFLLQLALK